MKRNYKVFSSIVIVNMIVMLQVLTPAYAGVGLYGKQQSVTSSTQTVERKQNLLSPSSSNSTGLFDTSTQSTLTVAPGNGNGSHVPVADGMSILLLMVGGYLTLRIKN